jgi:uncharacterized protein (DUF697 family)
MISIDLSQCRRRSTLDDFMRQGSIWTGIRALEPFPFFDAFSPVQLDMFMGEAFGRRHMFSKSVTKTVDEVAIGIVAHFKDKWYKLIEVRAMDYNLQSSGGKTTTEKVGKSEKRNLKNDNTNKVSAFNTDELITNDGSSSAGSDQLIADNTRTVTEANISLIDAFNNLSLLDKSNILSTVLKDVASYLTLDVY